MNKEHQTSAFGMESRIGSAAHKSRINPASEADDRGGVLLAGRAALTDIRTTSSAGAGVPRRGGRNA